ncbi:MAG TPA: hypothetical protein VG056_17235, partial [Pirellulales bacterium]|nr:hypothetical protein [Pirellulales bacterium]
PILAWGDSQSALPDAMNIVAQIATRRLQLRADLLKAIVPPAVFLWVALMILYYISLFLPFVSLIKALTGDSITSLSS